jgi:hypothetical protein
MTDTLLESEPFEKDLNQFNNLDAQSSQLLTLGLPVDGGREARIAQRKVRMEQKRMAKSKPTGEVDSKLF